MECDKERTCPLDPITVLPPSASAEWPSVGALSSGSYEPVVSEQQHYHQPSASSLQSTVNTNNQTSPVAISNCLMMCSSSVPHQTNGQIHQTAGSMMIMSTTPSPRAGSASSSPGYNQHQPNASPQHSFQTSRTPPSYGHHSPMNHQDAPTTMANGNGSCFDVVNRLKNRLDGYRGHHENALAKEQHFIDQYNHKIKQETNRLVKKQAAANEAASGQSARKKSSTLTNGTNATGRARTNVMTAGGNKRSSSCLMSIDQANSPVTGMTGANSSASSSPTQANSGSGSATKAKVPRMTAKQRKLLKQQQQQQQQCQVDSTTMSSQSMMAPNSQLMMNCSSQQQQQQSSTSSNDTLNGSQSASSVYKFDPSSPLHDSKPTINFLSNNSGLCSPSVSSYQHGGPHLHGHHHNHQQQQSITIKQENLSACNSPYLGQLDASSLHDLLDHQPLGPSDDDSKDLIINQILELDPDGTNSTTSNTSHTTQNGLLFNEYNSNSIFGTSADDSLSNRFGDEDFIKKMLEDLNNGFNNCATTSTLNPVNNQYSNNTSPIMNGHHGMEQHNLQQSYNNNNNNSNRSTPTMTMNQSQQHHHHSSSPSTSSVLNQHYAAGQHNRLPNFNQLRQTGCQSTNASLPSFNTIGNANNKIGGQTIRMANAQVPHNNQTGVGSLTGSCPTALSSNSSSSSNNNNNNNNNKQQAMFNQQTATSGNCSPMMIKSPYSARSNSTSAQSNLLLQPVLNRHSAGSPDPVGTTTGQMLTSQQPSNSPSPVSPHQNNLMRSTPPTSNTICSSNASNASVALKQMAQQQQQNKWNQTSTAVGGNCSNEFFVQQQHQMMMRPHQTPPPQTTPPQQQQRIMSQQQQSGQNYQSQQTSNILSSQLQNVNQQNTSLPNQFQQRTPLVQANSQYGQSPPSQQARSGTNGNFYQPRSNAAQVPQSQSIIRTQNIRTQRMILQQQQPKSQHRFNNRAAIFHASQPMATSCSSNQQQMNMASTQRFSSNNQNYWPQSQQQQQQPPPGQVGMLPSQQQTGQAGQSDQYSMQTHPYGTLGTNSAANGTSGYYS